MVLMLVCQASLVEKWLVLLPYSERVAGLIPVTVDVSVSVLD